MMDQKQKFSECLRSEYIGEAQADPDVKDRVLKGEVQLVFLTPETLINNKTFRNMLLSPPYQQNLVALVVDEAHCVKTWGDEFRKTFAQIGDIRSLIPSSVKVLALTATATCETYYVVTSRLSMNEPRLIAMPPFRDNISYTVECKCDVESLVQTIVDGIKEDRIFYPKTLIYVRTYSDCSDIYLQLRSKLGLEINDPPGCPSVAGHRLVDVFTRVSTNAKKDEVLQSFTEVGGRLRLVIATTAFGMGIDCPDDIRRIIHWGLPSTLEEYVQETGRCGRDGHSSEAILYRGKGGKHANTKVKNYVENVTTCRRRLLFQ